MKSIVRTLSTYVLLTGDTVPPIESVPVPYAKNRPTGRFIGSYGVQGTLKMFQELRRSAPSNVAVRRVDVRVNVGNSQNPMVTAERLAESKAMHLNILSVDLQQYLRTLLHVPEQLSTAQFIAFDPARLNTIWDDPLFSHLRVICWQHPTQTNPQFQLGAIASPDVVDSVQINNHPFPCPLELQFF